MESDHEVPKPVDICEVDVYGLENSLNKLYPYSYEIGGRKFLTTDPIGLLDDPFAPLTKYQQKLLDDIRDSCLKTEPPKKYFVSYNMDNGKTNIFKDYLDRRTLTEQFDIWYVDNYIMQNWPIFDPSSVPRAKIIPSNEVLDTNRKESEMEETKEKTTMKEKMSNAKTKVKNFVQDHKKGLIKGGIIAGAVAAIGGTVAAVVNRCGLPGDCDFCDGYEFEASEFEFDNPDMVVSESVEVEETTEE